MGEDGRGSRVGGTECEAAVVGRRDEIAGGIWRHVGTARKGLGLMTEATFERVPASLPSLRISWSLDEIVHGHFT